jgi:hypothetical protein
MIDPQRGPGFRGRLANPWEHPIVCHLPNR